MKGHTGCADVKEEGRWRPFLSLVGRCKSDVNCTID